VRVFVAIGMQHAMHMRHIAICGLPGSTTFIHILIKGAISKKKKVTEHKLRVLILSKIVI
jgi:hypothetical protein